MTKEKTMSAVETLVHYTDPNNGEFTTSKEYTELVNKLVKLPKPGSVDRAVLATMLVGYPITISDVKEWYGIIKPEKSVTGSNHTAHFVNVNKRIKPLGYQVAKNPEGGRIIIPTPSK